MFFNEVKPVFMFSMVDHEWILSCDLVIVGQNEEHLNEWHDFLHDVK